MLSKSYSWFTEGFDTRDLREARSFSMNCRELMRCEPLPFVYPDFTQELV
jgi:hypothetical protein